MRNWDASMGVREAAVHRACPGLLGQPRGQQRLWRWAGWRRWPWAGAWLHSRRPHQQPVKQGRCSPAFATDALRLFRPGALRRQAHRAGEPDWLTCGLAARRCASSASPGVLPCLAVSPCRGGAAAAAGVPAAHHQADLLPGGEQHLVAEQQL